jgi:heme/copper-type cytochrome/quinol oxidase subunit 3
MDGDLREPGILDVSDLPSVVFGARDLIWMGTFLYLLTNFMFMAVLVAAFFYLRTRVTPWPPSAPNPAWTLGLVDLGLLLGTLWPNTVARRAAQAGDLAKARVAMWGLAGFGTAAIIARIFLFGQLNIRWDSNAYGSIIVALVAFNSAHLLVIWIETIVLAVLLHTDRRTARTFVNLTTNANYWNFVIITWCVAWFMVYPLSHWI